MSNYPCRQLAKDAVFLTVKVESMSPKFTLSGTNRLKQILALVAFYLLMTQPVLAQVTVSKVWDKTLGGDMLDYMVAAIPTSDGGYLLAGTSQSGATGDKTEASRGNMDYWVVKLNADGS